VLANDFPRRLLNPVQRRILAENDNAPPHPHRPLPHNNNRMPNRPNPNPSVSTISISFSPDGRTLASTHGDHSVKITCAHTGKLIRTLEGHPRTPWTVKYHPINNRIVASGCLGFQVRIWDWNYRTESVRGKWRRDNERKYSGRYNGEAANVWDGRCCSPRGVMEGSSWKGNKRKEKKDVGEDDFAASSLEEMGIPASDPAWYDIQSESFNYHDGIGVCLNMIRLNHAIISLAFHPSGEILAVASGSTLHLWDYDEEGRKLKKKKLSDDQMSAAESSSTVQPQRRSESSILHRDRTSDFPTSRTLNISHESALRCVHFPPCGKTLIIGGVNPTSANEGLVHRHPRGRGGMSGGGMSFHLRLWDFDLDAVLNPPAENASANEGGMFANVLGATVTDEGEVTWNFSGSRKPISEVSIAC
jgi:WD40 repeat protein